METITKKIKKVLPIKVNTSSAIATELSLDVDEKDILVKSAKVLIVGIQPFEKTAKVNAKVIYNIVYLTGGEHECYESAAEWTADLSNDRINSSTILQVDGFAENVKIEKRDDILEISAIINLEGRFFSVEDVELVDDIEDAVCKKQQITAPVNLNKFCEHGELEGEKDFNFLVKKVVSQTEYVRIFECTSAVGEIIVEGEIISEFLFLTSGNEFTKDSFVMPFRYEIECDDCEAQDKAIVFARITDANYRVTADENSTSTHISAVYELEYCVHIFKIEETECVCDAFRAANYIKCDKEQSEILQNCKYYTYKYRCFGEAACDLEDKKTISSLCGRVGGINYKKDGENLVISGEIDCDVLCKKEDDILTENAVMPFTCEFPCDLIPADLTCIMRNVAVKQQGNKCYIECELIFTLTLFENSVYDIFCNFELGEERKQDNNAISIIFIEKGEDAWSVCKKAGISENELLEQNPALTFPTEIDSRILVYHELKN